MEQIENITWHDVKTLPTKEGWYLVTYQENNVTESYWNKKQKKWLVREMDLTLNSVIAWADMPKPYKENQ